MTYSRACELLDLTTPKSLKENAEIAKRLAERMPVGTPLRYRVAVQVIVEAAQ